MQIWLMSIVIVLCQLAAATGPELPEYYGTEFYSGYQSGSLRDQALLDQLQKTLASKHASLGYEKARQHLFGKLFLENLTGGWAVQDVYCERTFTHQELNIGPGQIPNGTVLNTEHTWPQSRFTNRFPKELQKSDLHHLFPTDNEMNSRRAAQRFGYVEDPVETLKCPIAKLGLNQEGDLVFEAPPRHRGNVARAIFYFATRYQMKVSPTEEKDLRRWHQEDPVDERESLRNDEIHQLQGDRNPYIDFPDLLERISHF